MLSELVQVKALQQAKRRLAYVIITIGTVGYGTPAKLDYEYVIIIQL